MNPRIPLWTSNRIPHAWDDLLAVACQNLLESSLLSGAYSRLCAIYVQSCIIFNCSTTCRVREQVDCSPALGEQLSPDGTFWFGRHGPWRSRHGDHQLPTTAVGAAAAAAATL
eukprot:6465333-Prymnesium_polylepis.1